eukprot:scaffold7390_cov248-Pinguiococcus_pyrenoidosus.AAC.2
MVPASQAVNTRAPVASSLWKLLQKSPHQARACPPSPAPYGPHGKLRRAAKKRPRPDPLARGSPLPPRNRSSRRRGPAAPTSPASAAGEHPCGAPCCRTLCRQRSSLGRQRGGGQKRNGRKAGLANSHLH